MVRGEDRRHLAALLALVLALTTCFFSARTEAAGSGEARVTALLEAITALQMRQSGDETLQGWVDHGLQDTADGTGGWYLQALSQGGWVFDASACRIRLEEAENVRSLTRRLRMALTLQALGSDAPMIREVATAAGADGSLMPLIFCLHLLNNGVEAEHLTREEVMDRLLALQLADGGWAVIGNACDVDCTAMALQSLAPLCGVQERAAAAAERGLAALAGAQLANGGFAGMGRESAESCAQVVLALSCLGIDCQTDGRFLRGGQSPLDALLRFRTGDGGFAHDREGESWNETATVQAFYALVGYRRLLRGQGAYYCFDPRPAAERAARTGASESGSPEARTGAAESGSPEARTGASESGSPAARPRAQAEAGAGELFPRWILYGAIGGLALLLCVVALIRGKRSWRTYAFILGVAALLALGASQLRIQSPEGYYAGNGSPGEAGFETTISIRCDTVAGQSAYAPADGVLLPETAIRLSPGQSALDQLLEATRRARLQMEYDGTAAGAYVRGIGYLYELDFGHLSGWMFRVNGHFADVGASQYLLAENDRVEWIYSTRIGKDVE